jgi:hypothetical protein
MLDAIAYLTFWYLIVGAICLWLIRKKWWSQYLHTDRHYCLATAISCLILIIIPAMPYLAVERKTALWKNELFPLTQRAVSQMYGEHVPIIMFKVLHVDSQVAEVYAVFVRQEPMPHCAAGFTFVFKREKNGWRYFGDYNGIWSDCSSASSNVFPPYRAMGDFNYS